MAFKKAPEQDTYSTVEFPFIKEMNSRGFDFGKDIDYVNVFITNKTNKLTQENSLTLQKRCGQSLISTSAVGAGRSVTGTFVWDGYYTGYKYLVLGLDNGVIKICSIDNTGTVTVTATIATADSGLSTNSSMGFTDFLYDNGTVVLVATDGTKLCQIDTSFVVTKCTDADFPATVVAQPIFLDGYIFLIKTLTGDIYNSDLNNPLSWTPGNFISTESSPDKINAIHKIKNYLVAVGAQSIEFFYNAGVASGSPLQVNRALTQQIGFADGNSNTLLYNDMLYLIGYNYNNISASGGINLYQVGIDGAKAIAPQELITILNGKDFGNSGRYGLLSMTTFGDIGSDILIISYADTSDATIYLALNMSNYTLTRLSGLNLAPKHCVRFNIIGAGPLNFIYFGEDSFIYIDDTVNADITTLDISFSFVTDLEDFDTINNKTMSRLVLVGEKPASTASVSVSWTDDDYQTFNTPISVDMYQELPSINRLGRFRRRAFKVSGSHKQPFSLSRIEVDINKGNS